MSKLKSLDLFTGAGGLAMGCTAAGFQHQALVERDKHSCQTINENQHQGMLLLSDWCLHQMDVRDFDYSHITEEIYLLTGGPPCQPFSIGGNHNGYLDQRDMFLEFLRGVRELHPKAFLIENVRGLVRRNFINYFEYILLQLNYPQMITIFPVFGASLCVKLVMLYLLPWLILSLLAFIAIYKQFNPD